MLAGLHGLYDRAKLFSLHCCSPPLSLTCVWRQCAPVCPALPLCLPLTPWFSATQQHWSILALLLLQHIPNNMFSYPSFISSIFVILWCLLNGSNRMIQWLAETIKGSDWPLWPPKEPSRLLQETLKSLKSSPRYWAPTSHMQCMPTRAHNLWNFGCRANTINGIW